MSGPHRNPDTINTIGIVVVGICGAVLVYVSIVALQAFYMSDTSEVQMMADYGGQDIGARTIRAEQVNAINSVGPNQGGTYRVPIEHAMELVVRDAKADPANLVPTQGRSDKRTIQPIFGRPSLAPAAPGAPAGGAGVGAGSGAPAAGASAGSAVPGAGAAQGAGNATTSTDGTPVVPLTPTAGQGPGGSGPPPGSGPTPGPTGTPEGLGPTQNDSKTNARPNTPPGATEASPSPTGAGARPTDRRPTTPAAPAAGSGSAGR